MTNVERNLQITNELVDKVFDCRPESRYEIIKAAYLEDISKSLASIADSLERLAPREHEDLNR